MKPVNEMKPPNHLEDAHEAGIRALKSNQVMADSSIKGLR
jgi:hypothetical protein